MEDDKVFEEIIKANRQMAIVRCCAYISISVIMIFLLIKMANMGLID